MEQETRIVRRYRTNSFTLPKAFRDHFTYNGECCVFITEGRGKCLLMNTRDEFMQMLGKLDAYNDRTPIRRLFSGSEPIYPDKSGRISISEELLAYAGISDSCRFVRRKLSSGSWKYEIKPL